MHKGYVNTILNDVYTYLGLIGSFAETKQRIIRIRLSLKTGLSMNKYTEQSEDKQEEVLKILEALKSPEFGLTEFPFQRYSS